jgi:hypothetical protein
MGFRGSIRQADGAWLDGLSVFLWRVHSFSYGHGFPTGFLHGYEF